MTYMSRISVNFIQVTPWGILHIFLYGGFRFGPDMSTSELFPFKMASKKTIEEPGV